MKVLQKVILTAVLLLAVNSYYSQSKEYTELYNSITPKLQETAAIKQKFYGKEFSEFYKYLNNKGLKVIKLSYLSVPSNMKKINVLELNFLNDEQQYYAYKNKFAEPYIYIFLLDEIPQEIRAMVFNTHGFWNEDFAQFLSKLRIEKMEFYGLEGISNRYYTKPR